MAELTPEQIIEFFNKLSPQAAQEYFQKLEGGSKIAYDAIKKLHGGTQELQTTLSSTVEIADKVKESLVNITKTNLGQVVQHLSEGNRELLGMITKISLVGLALGGIRSDTLNALSQSASDVNVNFQSTLDTIDQFGYSNNSFIKFLSTLHQAAAPARNLEAGLLGAASSSGELGSFLRETGTDLEGLDRKMTSFVDLTYDLAQASGLSVSQVAGFASEISKIPGVLSTTIDLENKGITQLHMLDAAMKVAAGTGQKFSSVVDDLNDIYRNYNTTGEKALQLVARLSSASAGLKIPLDIVKEYTKNASSQFKFFGDNTQSALNILNKFAPSLKASGLGPAAVAELTRGMTDNIARLDVAQRAFVSQTSGGPGGLQGSYQIELLKQQGRLDQVQSMVEKSLRQQFGGRIVTLEEAARSPAAAAQFTKEVQLLTTGPTKIANTEGEAYKILEAMSKGFKAPAGVTEAVATPEDALKSSLEVGNAWQERNYNELVVQTNKLDLVAMHTSMMANAATRQFLGPATIPGQKEDREKAAERAGNRSILVQNTPNKEMTSTESVLDRLENLGSAFDSFEKLEGAFNNIRKGFEEEMQKISPPSSTGKDRSEGGVESPLIKFPALFQEPKEEKNTGAGPVKTAAVGSGNQSLSINHVSTCPECQKKSMTQIAQVIFDGSINNVKKGEVNHIHTGANIG